MPAIDALPILPAGCRYRHPRQTLDARTRCSVLRRRERLEPAGGGKRGRSLLLVAGPGVRLQGRAQRDQPPASEGRHRARTQIRSQGVRRHRRPWWQRAARRAGEKRGRVHSLRFERVSVAAVTHVVLLRGVNVGGHRTFRPARLAEQLRHLGAVNIGAAGTFVIRESVSQSQLRAELARRLPFETHIIICPSRMITRLLSRDWFAGRPSRPDIVRFVSVLSRAPRLAPRLPMTLPPGRSAATAATTVGESAGTRGPLRDRRAPTTDEGDRLSRYAGPSLWRSSDDTKLDHHHRDCQ